MDYEKKYKEAIERMKSWARGEHPECFSEAQKAAEFVFPELADSEDEKIRKALVRFHKSTIDIDGIKGADIIAWLEKQGKVSVTINVDKMIRDYANNKERGNEEFGKPVNCMIRAYRQGIMDALEKQGEQKPVDKVEPFDKYEGLTDFERTLADICIGWIGEELGWKQYIKDNADVLLKIAIKKFNSIQDAPFEQKSAAWSDEDENYLQSAENACEYQYGKNTSTILWLKSLKDRIGG